MKECSYTLTHSALFHSDYQIKKRNVLKLVNFVETSIARFVQEYFKSSAKQVLRSRQSWHGSPWLSMGFVVGLLRPSSAGSTSSTGSTSSASSTSYASFTSSADFEFAEVAHLRPWPPSISALASHLYCAAHLKQTGCAHSERLDSESRGRARPYRNIYNSRGTRRSSSHYSTCRRSCLRARQSLLYISHI